MVKVYIAFWLASLMLVGTVCEDKGRISRLPLCTIPKPKCKGKYRYRLMDGTCNNEKHPHYGRAGATFRRLIPPDYANGVGQIRLSANGSLLPNPRSISNIFSEKVEKRSPTISHMHVMWGQLVAHDLAHNIILKNKNSTDLDCNCSNPHAGCENIPLEANDQQYIEGGKQCLHFSRSKIASGENCIYAKQQQVNRVTSFIDGSVIYGTSDKEASTHRDKESDAGELLPGVQPAGSHPPHSFCESSSGCFASGDPRGGENPALLSFHTVWIRYHNRVARRLKAINPKWNSNKVFKVTRNIITSLLQMITYRDYLPPLVGNEWMRQFQLETLSEGFWYGYDPEYHPGVTNAFNTAAFRYGHSQVSSFFSLPDCYFRRAADWVATNEMFTFEPNVTENRFTFGAAMRGLMMDAALKMDTAMVDGLRNHALRKRNERFGGDLFAINVQRGRDNGLPGYNQYRTLCGLEKVQNFTELSNEIQPDKITLLRKAYQSVDDVDLFVGGLAEEPVLGGLVGPTFACILAYQFRAIRKGDRYWYEGGIALTLPQLQSLRKVTFSKILCETGEDMTHVTRHPMLLPTNANNDMVSCYSLPEIDLNPWKVDHVKPNSKVSPETEWTVWFPTTARSRWVLDTAVATSNIRRRRTDHICSDIKDHEIRSVPSSNFVQIRFKCYVGSIAASNFPSELSENYRWSDWLVSKPLMYADGIEVVPEDYGCGNPVALQINSSNTGFSLQEADVFEEYSVQRGIVCKHRDQMSGLCQNIRARALCTAEDSETPTITTSLEKSAMKSFMGEFFAKLCVMMNVCLPVDEARTTLGL